jgi:hypothetical protein
VNACEKLRTIQNIFREIIFLILGNFGEQHKFNSCVLCISVNDDAIRLGIFSAN